MQVADRVADIPASVWMDSVGPGALFRSASWFRAAELSGSGLKFILTRESVPAALPYHARPVGTRGAYDHYFHILAPALGELAEEWTPLLTVGSWTSTISFGAIGNPESDGFTTSTKDVISQALSLAADRGERGISWPFLTRDAAKLIASVMPENVLMLRTLPTTLMTADHNSFDSYLAALPAKTRWSFMRDERKFSNASLQLSVEPLSHILHEMDYLYTDGRQLGRGRLETEATHNAFMEVFGDGMIAFTAWQGNKLAAVATAVVSHGGLYLRSFAADKEVTGSDLAYFVLTYNSPQRYAFDHGLRWIHAGVHAYEAKARRGFQLIPLWTAFIKLDGVTEKERELGRAWNRAQKATWREWHKTKLCKDLSHEWEWEE